MESIEERAHEKCKFFETGKLKPIGELAKCAYIQGATEQRAIDIDKACEVYENELRQMKKILNEVKDGAGELISVGGSLIQFRKAMEDDK